MDKLCLSAIIPSYNKMANLQKGVSDKINYFLDKQKFEYEVIIVDDKSDDGSIKQLCHLFLINIKTLDRIGVLYYNV